MKRVGLFFFFLFKFWLLHLKALRHSEWESVTQQTEEGGRMACCFLEAWFSSPTQFSWDRSPTLNTPHTHTQNPPISIFICSTFLWLWNNIDIKDYKLLRSGLGWKSPSHSASGRFSGQTTEREKKRRVKRVLQGLFTMPVQKVSDTVVYVLFMCLFKHHSFVCEGKFSLAGLTPCRVVLIGCLHWCPYRGQSQFVYVIFNNMMFWRCIPTENIDVKLVVYLAL